MKLKLTNDAHKLFKKAKIKPNCTWPGTKWNGNQLLICGKPTVGMGLFCDPDHKYCEIHSVCEAHSRNGETETWDKL